MYTAAAAAKSLQSCPNLCDPIDSSPPGSPVPGILQARTLEWVAISFSNAWKWKVKVKSLSHVQLEQPHGLQPTRLLHLWDFLGKSTGVACHCLLRPLGLTGLISLLSKTLKSLLKHHSSKASILRCSAFFMVQLSHPYITTGKSIFLTIWTFFCKVVSLLFSFSGQWKPLQVGP